MAACHNRANARNGKHTKPGKQTASAAYGSANASAGPGIVRHVVTVGHVSAIGVVGY